MFRIVGPLVDADTLGLRRCRHIGDRGREHEPRGTLSAARSNTDGIASLDIELRADEENLGSPVIRRIESGVGLCEGCEPIPGRRRELVIVERRLQERKSQAILGDELDDEDVLGRKIVVRAEVFHECIGELIDRGTYDAVYASNRCIAGGQPPRNGYPRARVVRRAAKAAAVLREYAGVDVHARQDGIGGALGEAPVVGCVPRPGQVCPGREELRLDELENRVSRVTHPRLDGGRGDDRNAAKQIQQLVIVERPQRPQLRDNSCLLRGVHHRPALQCREHHVGVGDAGEVVHPGRIDVLETRRAGRGPGLPVHLEPAAVVIPVLAAGRHDHLVGADFAEDVVRAAVPGECTAELRVDSGEAGQRFRLVVEECPRGDAALGHLIELRACLHEPQ